MNASEAAIVLGLCAAYDRRTVGQADALAWAEALPDIPVEDAKAAVVQHYRENRQWIMPADVYNRAMEFKRRRFEAAGIFGPIPHDFLPTALEDNYEGQEAWKAEFRTRIGLGYSEQEADQLACRAAGVTRAPDDPLRSLTWHRQQHTPHIGA